MYPEADIPCIQLSLLKSLDPDSHISLGKSLQAIEREDLLIIGSGFSFHNMRAFFSKDNELTLGMNQSFEEWLRDTCANQSMTESERRLRLLRWETAPNARYCHPREEHLLPLHVCYGYAEAPCSEAYSLEILGKNASMYLWQAPNSGKGVKG
jgi:aromatic ring-opening dioxygenase catalytic subunit (LigB family)